ncbi:MAG: helix-turn-helix domain-containing protein [Janthinobacterium lividum]
MRRHRRGTLEPLQRHDATHSATPLNTAVLEVDEGGRLQVAADRLGIHVSILRYRLKRSLEVSGLDVTDAEARFQLALASRLSTVGRVGPSSEPLEGNSMCYYAVDEAPPAFPHA